MRAEGGAADGEKKSTRLRGKLLRMEEGSIELRREEAVWSRTAHGEGEISYLAEAGVVAQHPS